MSKKAVKRYLEDLLVELEVNPTKEAQVKFVNTINRYHIYNLQKYVEKEFQIPKIPYNKKEGK
jgi:glutaredoxin